MPLSDSSLYWNINIDGFRVGTESTHIAHGLPYGYLLDYQSTATLDTGTSLMNVPSELYHTLERMLLHGKAVTQDVHGNLYTSCDLNTYKSLFLLVGSDYFEVPPSSYIIQNGKLDLCLFGIQASKGHDWLLGDVFLRNFYSVFDNGNSQVGLIPHKTSNSTVQTTSTLLPPTITFSRVHMLLLVKSFF